MSIDGFHAWDHRQTPRSLLHIVPSRWIYCLIRDICIHALYQPQCTVDVYALFPIVLTDHDTLHGIPGYQYTCQLTVSALACFEWADPFDGGKQARRGHPCFMLEQHLSPVSTRLILKVLIYQRIWQVKGTVQCSVQDHSVTLRVVDKGELVLRRPTGTPSELRHLIARIKAILLKVHDWHSVWRDWAFNHCCNINWGVSLQLRVRGAVLLLACYDFRIGWWLCRWSNSHQDEIGCCHLMMSTARDACVVEWIFSWV